MPDYTYFNERYGVTVTISCSLGEAPPEMTLCRDFSAVNTQASAGWPMACEAMAVAPGERGEAYSLSCEKGVPTNFDSEGRAVFENKRHRDKFLRAFGATDLGPV